MRLAPKIDHVGEDSRHHSIRPYEHDELGRRHRCCGGQVGEWQVVATAVGGNGSSGADGARDGYGEAFRHAVKAFIMKQQT